MSAAVEQTAFHAMITDALEPATHVVAALLVLSDEASGVSTLASVPPQSFARRFVDQLDLWQTQLTEREPTWPPATGGLVVAPQNVLERLATFEEFEGAALLLALDETGQMHCSCLPQLDVRRRGQIADHLEAWLGRYGQISLGAAGKAVTPGRRMAPARRLTH